MIAAVIDRIVDEQMSDGDRKKLLPSARLFACAHFALALCALWLWSGAADGAAPGTWLAVVLFANAAAWAAVLRQQGRRAAGTSFDEKQTHTPLPQSSPAEADSGPGAVSAHALAGRLAETLAAFERADRCLVLWRNPAGGGISAREARRGLSHRDAASDIPDESACSLLLGLTPEAVLAYCRAAGAQHASVRALHSATLQAAPADPALAARIARLLGSDSFISFPLRGNRTLGSVLISSRGSLHSTAGIRFMLQLAGEAACGIEQAQRAQRIESAAALAERRRIAGDLRDGILQPCVGLKLGIEALRRKLPANHPLAAELNELAAVASEGIQELRDYAAALAGAVQLGERRVSLLEAVRREADRFSRCYGIDVRLAAETDVPVREPLGEEVKRLVRKALFNIHEHTSAEHAVIDWRMQHALLRMDFINDDPGGRLSPEFLPRSLDERARRLGGRVEVAERSAGRTAVSVAIPL